MTKNYAEIIGFVGQDPKVGGSLGNCRVRLSVATTERWRDGRTGEKRERTEWHNVICWDRLADIATEYVRKGAHILVSGSMRSRQYEDNGVKHTVWELHARELLLLDPRATANDEVDEPATPPPPAEATPA
jgi:single-strand DNA-binding protein